MARRYSRPPRSCCCSAAGRRLSLLHLLHLLRVSLMHLLRLLLVLLLHLLHSLGSSLLARQLLKQFSGGAELFPFDHERFVARFCNYRGFAKLPDAPFHGRDAARAPHICSVSVPGTDSASMLMAGPVSSVIQVFSSRVRSGNGFTSNAGDSRH